MESSEDDAGNATSASCRASAREKDIGQAEDVGPTRNTQHEPPEATASCKTPTMSEDNFDGDSVPSPSAQDVNTSTEAILDMIDEFVDGPGAPKRLPLSADVGQDFEINDTLGCVSETVPQQQTIATVEQPQTPPPAPIDKSEILSKSIPIKSEECSPHTEDSRCANTSSNVSEPQTSSVSVDKTDTSSNQSENNSVVINAEPESLAIQSVSDSPSSSVQTVQSISNISECEQSERTVKCVRSSENKDCVTVERAESTSSECSVSDSKGLPMEPLNRSPLKRRLVRPVPSDRRPDSTVSSTVDSQTADHTMQPASCDVVVKDVSSSSDAVPLHHGNVKPEGISNVSEISICKAETSTAPKKIRLVRPKLTSVLSNSVKTPEALTPEKEQCQSTSSDDHASLIFPVKPTTSRVDTRITQGDIGSSAPVNSAADNITIQVPETVPHPKPIEEVKDVVISSIKNATPSVTANLISESPTIQSYKQKSDAQEAPSEIQSKEVEPINTESSSIQSELKPTDVLLKVSVPDQIQSKPSEPMKIKPSLVFKTEKESKVLKPSNVQSIESATVQSKLDTSHVQLIEIQSKKLTPTESQLEEREPAKSQSKELKSSEIKSKTLPITVSQSIVMESTEVQTEEQISTDCISKNLKPTEGLTQIQSKQELLKNQPKVEPSTLVQSTEEPTEKIYSKVVEPTQLQSKEPTESQPKIVEPNLVQPKEKLTEKSQLRVAEELVSSQVQSKELTISNSEVVKPTLVQSKAELAKNSLKVFEPPKEEPKEDQSKVVELTLIQSKEKPGESKSPKVLEPIKVQSKEKSAEGQSKQVLIKSQPNVLEPTQVQQEILESTESHSKVMESTESKSKVLEQTQVELKELEPSESQPKDLEVMESQPMPQLVPTQSQTEKSESVQAQSISTGNVQLVPLQVEPSQLKPTNIDSRETEPMEVESNLKELKESMAINQKETEPNLIVSGTMEKQTLDDSDVNKRPPIKMTLTKVSKVEKKINDEGADSKDTNVIDTSRQIKQDLDINTDKTTNCDTTTKKCLGNEVIVDQKKVPPIKLNLTSDHNSSLQSSPQKFNTVEEKPSQIPKLTIKLGNKQTEEMKSPIPKLTIKPIRPPTDQNIQESLESSQQIPSITKLNIKPIVNPGEQNDSLLNEQANRKEQIPSITKLNIKPIHKPAEKINDIHRKSSSSEISESEYSENDETSTSDQASASDQGQSDTVPKVTIKLGKPGTESEGKFYTEKNIPKLTIKGLQQNENDDKELKLVISQSEDATKEKIPKLTIKTVSKSEGQPLSPKLIIKPIKPPENDSEIPKLKITTDAFGLSSEIKENLHVPKITIKAVTKTDSDTITKTPKKSTLMCDSSDHIPVVTKLNIKPILKPTESGESSEELVDKVPVVSKLNIKPIVKPKDNEVDSSVDDVPKIIKLNIKPLKNPEENSSERKDCDENIDDMVDKSIPVITKLNIKPIVKPEEDEGLKDSENQSSETGTSSDDNSDHIPVVTKLNIKPIIKPSEMDEVMKPTPNEQSIPVVTKLNIKPLVKPEDNTLPSSPKRESLKSPGSSGIPNVTKLNIKPIVKPEDTYDNKIHEENVDKSTKNPPLVMKINMKNVCDNILDQKYNNYVDGMKSPKQPMSPKIKKASLTPDRDHTKSIAANVETLKDIDCSPDSSSLTSTVSHGSIANYRHNLPEKIELACSKENKSLSKDSKQVHDKIPSNKLAIQVNEVYERNTDLPNASPISPGFSKQKKSLQNCTLLKQLLSNTKDDSEKSREMSVSNCLPQSDKPETSITNCNTTTNVKTLVDEIRKHNSDLSVELGRRSPISEGANDMSQSSKYLKARSIQEVRKESNESVTKPLEIVTDKVSNQSSGQDSPRIILKINKTDHGSSAKIITEECHKPKDSPPQNHAENTYETVIEKQSPKKHYVNSRKKQAADEAISLTIGKRLRSSRVVETPEKPPVVIRRTPGKRASVSETSPTSNKESALSILDSKRLKLEQLLAVNKGLTITPVASNFTQTSLSKPHMEIKQSERKNHSLLNNDNSKNGNSKLHNILSNLQAKQMQSLQLSEATIVNKNPIILPDAESNTSTGSSDVVVEISRIENRHPDVQEMIINENSEFRDILTPDEVSQDPLEVDALKIEEKPNEPASMKVVEVTPTPRKRGRPRKIPLSEGAKPAKPTTPPVLPVPALEERPQRSLRLMRDRPTIQAKPRGRGRGRGGRRAASPVVAPNPPSDEESTETLIVIETLDEDEPQRPRTPPPRPATPEDPTSSRIKLPRMTEALDKSSACITPLSSRRRSSGDMKLFGEPAVVIESPIKLEEYMKSPDAKGVRGRGGRGSRGTPRGRTPRGRGRGRGGGKGATYMKETMGIYGRVCGPATTTIELFEEETCMMDDNATPSKPSHLLDEDSQSSVKSSTNESSSKMKKSKFADLFDSNKVWTASDVKEYTWPPPDVPNVDRQIMMIQEQVAMFLGVKSFKRRYAELKRRAVVGEEKDYCLRRGIVTEALCDLGITAVDASDVLDIMLSDYPHKYEEYRSYQRQKQLTESLEEADLKLEEKATKIELKSEKTSDKPEPPKVDPEKTRQDMAAAAIASAAEWNAMANAWRRPACVDLQSNMIHRRRPPPTAAPTHCRPPHGFYPHAILPGQFQHTYTQYTPQQLRYFPLNTVIAAPPAPPSPVESSSESEGSWADSSSSSDESHGPHHSAKRKKLTKVKRSSQHEPDKEDSRSGAPEEVVDLCRVCKLRLEANRKYTHERFLVCSNCNAKLHPSCLELNADTIRKCREYAWQCAECKTCCACRQPTQDDKMLFCDLCDRGLHIHCVGLDQVPSGRWHCVECAICKSCGARDPNGLPTAAGTPGPSGAPGEWHHQTRRGPGGHKVYSHSLCTPCARAYRIGRYCPLCERSFIGPKGTMQLVICKLCDRQLHQECVRPLVGSGGLRVLDYTCAECRRGGITSRAGAVRAAPRTIATLFMAKRRFNKYAHKQYMQSRRQEKRDAPDACDPDASDPLDATDATDARADLQ